MAGGPPQAIIEEDDQTFVYVVKDGTAELREVTVGARLPDRIYVSEGLSEGESVIVGGGHKVSDGDPVISREEP